MVMRDWRERQVFMILSIEYCADSVVGLEGGDTNRPVCDLVIGAACEPSQVKADGRSMLAECGDFFSRTGVQSCSECDDSLLARSVSKNRARKSTSICVVVGCYCWLFDIVDARARVDKQSR